MAATNVLHLSDYSLVGKDSLRAIQAGLAKATWHTSPVPKEKMAELLTRRDWHTYQAREHDGKIFLQLA